MLTIGVDASRANRPDRTGTEWYSYELLRHWRSLQPPDVRFRLYFETPPATDLLPLPESMVPRVLRWPPRFLWTQGRLSAEMLFHRPDLLFIPTHTIPIVHPRLVVTTIHDIGFEHVEDVYAPTPIGGSRFVKGLFDLVARTATAGRFGSSEYDYQRWAVRHAIRVATKIIAVSQFTANDLTRTLGCPPQKLIVIPNGIDHDHYRPIRDESTLRQVMDRYGVERPFLLSIGRVEAKKNVGVLLEAFHRLCRARREETKTLSLVLAGTPGYGFDAIETRIRELRLTDRVRLPGFVPEADLPALLSASAAFVFPSRFEGFGIPVLEAMACGTPVIASNVAALPEVCGGAALLVDPLDPDALADAVAQVLTNPGRRADVVDRGFRQAAKYSWELTARKTLDFLLNAAAEKR